jgi:hypothetical protein
VPDHATFDEKGTVAALHDEERYLDLKPPAAKRKSVELDEIGDEIEDAIMAEKKAARSAEMQKRLDSDSSSDDDEMDWDSKPAAKRKSDEPEGSDDELEDGDDELEEAITAKQQAEKKFARHKEGRKRFEKLNKKSDSSSSDDEEVDLDSKAAAKRKSDESEGSGDELEEGGDELKEPLSAKQQAEKKFAQAKERRERFEKLNGDSDDEEVDLNSKARSKRKSDELESSDDELEDAIVVEQQAKKADAGAAARYMNIDDIY